MTPKGITEQRRADDSALPAPLTRSRVDGATATPGGAAGLTNARSRIVGDRTGLLADIVVGLVRSARATRTALGRAAHGIADVVTPLGWAMAVVAPLALLAGYALGWLELVVIGFASVILLAVATIYLIGRTTVTIEIETPIDHVVVGDPAAGTIVVRNPASRRVLGTQIEIPVGDGVVAVATPSIAGGGSFEHRFDVPSSRRGIVSIGPVRSVRADPIGLVRRDIVWEGARELYVHPRTVRLPSTSTGLIRDLEGKPTRDLTNSDVSFHALREYVPGDERRYIHWKSTAKTGTHMVRQFEQTRRSRLVVALSLSTGDYADVGEFEMAVSAAASLGLRAIRDARDVAVVVGDVTPAFAKRKVLGITSLPAASPRRLLDSLSGVEREESALGMLDTAALAADSVPGISVAFLVCGSTPTVGELRAASVHFALDVEVVAVVCDPEASPGLRRIAGLTVLTIGYLDDLQRSLSRSAAA
ncbi:DUF58 domain-containing protein [Marisediminicola sp. LYQ134]|uniref:DUF58 domain-containing protein n=1 Tax=Marisediminicola sp. LYQ134 TaxID=3391061 RepID=UPI003982DD4C